MTSSFSDQFVWARESVLLTFKSAVGASGWSGWWLIVFQSFGLGLDLETLSQT
jgi:hypothetical protein